MTAADTLRALERTGFALARQSGSHRILKNPAGRRVTVPFHSGSILHPKLLKSILWDAGLTVAAFQELL